MNQNMCSPVLQSADRVVNLIDSMRRKAHYVSSFWRVVSFTMDATVAAASVFMIVQGQVAVSTATWLQTTVGAVLAASKSCEVLGNIRERNASALSEHRCISKAFHRAQEARDLLTCLAEDGVAEKERGCWTRTMAVIQSLMQMTEDSKSLDAKSNLLVLSTISEEIASVQKGLLVGKDVV